MTPLRRHQLAYLSAAGWRQVLAHPLDPRAAVLLATWQERRWPLVVGRQCADAADGQVTLGWPAPLSCARLRLSLRVAGNALAWLDEFPGAMAAMGLLSRKKRLALEPLLQSLVQLGTRPRVYGSYGWQLTTGLDYVHAASDLDLWLSVTGAQQADAAVALLQGCPQQDLRVDGELMFPGGAAVAWREYAAWRAGRTRSMLVKHLDSATLESVLPMPAWCEESVA